MPFRAYFDLVPLKMVMSGKCPENNISLTLFIFVLLALGRFSQCDDKLRRVVSEREREREWKRFV